MADRLLVFTYILSAIVFEAAWGACDDKSTCSQCVKSAAESQPDVCRWCPLSKQCHASSNTDNPCAGSEKLDISLLEHCPAEDLNLSYNYTAAYQHVLLSAAAYSETPDQCLAKIREGNPLFDFEVLDDNFIARRCDDFYFDYKMCTAVVAVSNLNREIVLSYRGTAHNLQLLDQVLAALLIPKMKMGKGSIHAYFLNAFEALIPCARERLEMMIQMYPDYTLTISGHSLGGAMASISAFNLSRENFGASSNSGIRLFTYGHPRVGDKVFSAEHDKVVPDSWRIVHRKDIVPHVPHCLPSCDSGGDSTNYHHGTEVFYDVENMTNPSARYKICQANHDITCSRKYTQFFSWDSPVFDPVARYSDHLRYFGISVGSHCNNLLGIGSRRKRSITESLYSKLRSDKCSALHSMDGEWVPEGYENRNSTSVPPAVNDDDNGAVNTTGLSRLLTVVIIRFCFWSFTHT